MNNEELLKHCSALLESFGKPGVIVFAFQDGKKMQMVKCQREMQQITVVQVLSWALNDALKLIIPPEA